MRIKEGVERRKIGQHEMVCKTLGDTKFDICFALNETGAFLWDGLIRGDSEKTLLAEMMQEYEAGPEDAEMISNDVKEFLNQLRSIGVLED